MFRPLSPRLLVSFLCFPAISHLCLYTSPVTNPLYLVTVEDNGPITSTDEPISVHPDWTLAAWSVDKGQPVSGDRIGAQTLATYYLDGDYDSFTDMHSIVAAQSLSLIGYSMKDIDAADSVPTPTRPVLQVNLLAYVSRTGSSPGRRSWASWSRSWVV